MPGAPATLTDLSYFIARIGGEAAGCAAFKEIAPGHGELKTLHVAPAHRGRGIGLRLIIKLEEAARQRGLIRLSLETGRSEGFAASRRLYQRCGFASCPPFGVYADDPFSYCMTKSL